MKRLFFFIFLHLIVFLILIASYVNAEEKVVTCKPTIAGLQLDNGNYYFENDKQNFHYIKVVNCSFLICFGVKEANF